MSASQRRPAPPPPVHREPQRGRGVRAEAARRGRELPAVLRKHGERSGPHAVGARRVVLAAAPRGIRNQRARAPTPTRARPAAPGTTSTGEQHGGKPHAPARRSARRARELGAELGEDLLRRPAAHIVAASPSTRPRAAAARARPVAGRRLGHAEPLRDRRVLELADHAQPQRLALIGPAAPRAPRRRPRAASPSPASSSIRAISSSLTTGARSRSRRSARRSTFPRSKYSPEHIARDPPDPRGRLAARAAAEALAARHYAREGLRRQVQRHLAVARPPREVHEQALGELAVELRHVQFSAGHRPR